MANYKSSGKLVVLESHTATGTEATHTYTNTLTSVKYSKIMIVISGEVTAALELQLKINGLTDYYNNAQVGTSATIVLDQNTTAFIQLCSATYLAAANDSFAGTISIIPQPSSFDDEKVMGHYQFYMEGTACSSGAFMTTGVVSDITSIEILTSTSTWKAGTNITIYGLLK